MPKTEAILDTIKCPGYGETIPISETIYHQVVERAERDLRAKSLQRERALAEKEMQLQAREETFDHRVQEQVQAATADLRAHAVQQARQSVSLELADLRRQAAEKDEKLQAAEKAELRLRKQKRELEERERRLELETARKLDEERRKIEEQAVRKVARFILAGLYTGTRSAAICGAALMPTVGRGHVDLERGVFYRRAIGRRQTKKRQPQVKLPPRLLAPTAGRAA